MASRRVGAVLFAVGTVAFAGCGGGDGGTSTNDALRACDFLTDAEVDELLGTPTRSTYDDDRGIPGSYCSWGSTDSEFGDAADADYADEDVYSLDIDEIPGERGTGGFEARSRNDEAEPVDGIGDKAFFEPLGNTGQSELNVRVGDRTFSVDVFGNSKHSVTDAERRQIERRAAELAVGRLTK
jgi:hypothetical protein